MRSFRVKINGAVVKWALKYGEPNDIKRMTKKYHKHIKHWEDGSIKPTFCQLCDFSNAMRVPFNCFLNKSLPKMPKLYAGYRTVNDKDPLSLQLIDVLDTMRARQSWMRIYMLSLDNKFHFHYLHFISSRMSVADAAHRVAQLLNINKIRDSVSGYTIAAVRNFLNKLRHQISDLGIIIMKNGVDGTSTRRRLHVKTFRAFALYDRIMPLIFINNTDSKRAQVFSLVHELIHILLGANEVLNVSIAQGNRKQGEHWINKVAACVLIPSRIINNDYSLNPRDMIRSIASSTYTSELAVAVRLKESNVSGVDQSIIDKVRKAEYKALKRIHSKTPGRKKPIGDYYNNLISRVDNHFASAVVTSAAEGQITFGKAASMLDVSLKSYDKAAKRIVKAGNQL